MVNQRKPRHARELLAKVGLAGKTSYHVVFRAGNSSVWR